MKLSYSTLRNDFIRLLLINGIYDLEEINKRLENYSFFSLNPELPFDYLVIALMFLGTGQRIDDIKAEKDPYEILVHFFERWIC